MSGPGAALHCAQMWAPPGSVTAHAVWSGQGVLSSQSGEHEYALVSQRMVDGQWSLPRHPFVQELVARSQYDPSGQGQCAGKATQAVPLQTVPAAQCAHGVAAPPSGSDVGSGKLPSIEAGIAASNAPNPPEEQLTNSAKRGNQRACIRWWGSRRP
jgi:hypothetical protein